MMLSSAQDFASSSVVSSMSLRSRVETCGYLPGTPVAGFAAGTDAAGGGAGSGAGAFGGAIAAGCAVADAAGVSSSRFSRLHAASAAQNVRRRRAERRMIAAYTPFGSGLPGFIPEV